MEYWPLIVNCDAGPELSSDQLERVGREELLVRSRQLCNILSPLLQECTSTLERKEYEQSLRSGLIGKMALDHYAMQHQDQILVKFHEVCGPDVEFITSKVESIRFNQAFPSLNGIRISHLARSYAKKYDLLRAFIEIN